MSRRTIVSGIAWMALGVVLCARSARADDWYVDAVNGSVANPGTSPAAPWRTITHALAVIAPLPAGPHVVWVAPGVYDPALGEAFPLNPRPRTRISGTGGSALTIVQGPGQRLFTFGYVTSAPIDAESGADGLTLRQAGTGILFAAGGGDFYPAFWDLRIEGMTTAGVSVSAYTAGPFPGHGLEPVFERTEIVGCGTGVTVHSQRNPNDLWWSQGGVVLIDSVVRGSSNQGIRASSAPIFGATARVELVRSRVVENLGHGLHGELGNTVVVATASLFAQNQGCGLLGENGSGAFTLNGCTVASNVQGGLRGTSGQQATIRNTILASNGNDLDLQATPTASFSDSADGDLLGQPGCIAADPRFVAPGSGEFRLRFGSPCVDTGDPASSGARDLLGHARPFDGDLDTQLAVDMGAFEFEPLHLVGAPAVGGRFGLEFWGPAGGKSIVHFARAPLAAGQVTPFGTFYLGPSLALSGAVPVQPNRPIVLWRTLANDPALAGTTFSFQGLTSSSAAPLGRAYTNPVSFVVLP